MSNFISELVLGESVQCTFFCNIIGIFICLGFSDSSCFCALPRAGRFEGHSGCNCLTDRFVWGKSYASPNISDSRVLSGSFITSAEDFFILPQLYVELLHYDFLLLIFVP